MVTRAFLESKGATLDRSLFSSLSSEYIVDVYILNNHEWYVDTILGKAYRKPTDEVLNIAPLRSIHD